MEAWQYPWETPPVPDTVPSLPDAPVPPAKPRGRRAASVTRPALTTARTSPGWLYHHLTVSGTAELVDKFAATARGAGVIPWQMDLAALEEDIFLRAVSEPTRQRQLTVEGCRLLARQFRGRVEARQAHAVALVGHSVAFPFDLQALLPVPPAILQLGPAHPAALTWLATHWGTTDRLRQVRVRPQATAGRRLPAGHAVVGYGFFTAGETPHAAIAQLAPRWPALRFRLQPRPVN